MGKWRILVVDDEPDIRDLVRTSLEPEYEIVDARDGLDALEKLERAQPDLVVLDVMMPLMDGIQTCEAIRKKPRYSDITVLFLSALTSQQDIRKGYDVGANLYLTKPFDPARLKRNIDVFFEKRAGQEPPPRTFSLPELAALDHSGPSAISAATSHTNTAAAPPSPAPASSSDTPQATTIRPRILVVDDEPGICALATQALQHRFEVFCAADGIDAISKIATYQPDLILIDTMMPRMSGYQLCQSLRQNARYTHTPIILASSKQSHKDREYSLKIGANAFLQKPYTGIEASHVAEEMTHLPHFRIHPKALTAKMIHQLEHRHEDDKHETVSKKHHREDIHDLQDFVRRHTGD